MDCIMEDMLLFGFTGIVSKVSTVGTNALTTGTRDRAMWQASEKERGHPAVRGCCTFSFSRSSASTSCAVSADVDFSRGFMRLMMTRILRAGVISEVKLPLKILSPWTKRLQTVA